MTIKHFIKLVSTPQQRIQYKRFKRHLKALVFKKSKTNLEELKDVLLYEFGLKAGDRIIVSSSFGNLNGNYTPKDVVELLMEIVTPKGTIMMPYYPPTNSTIWAKENQVFDMVKTKSGTGVLTNVFSKMPGVIKTLHPTKAVCVWGKDAEELSLNHDKSTTPFYWDSPYGRLLIKGSKSLGLGLKNIPIFHTFEDVLANPYSFHYQSKKYKLKLIKEDKSEVEIETYVHDDKILDKCPAAGDYVASLHPKSFKKLKFGTAFLFTVDNNELFETVKEACLHDNARYHGLPINLNTTIPHS